jgi:1-acyl-sn-glycerol-3-phosphate acyltransferase
MPFATKDFNQITPAYCNRWRFYSQCIAVMLMQVLGVFWFKYHITGREKLPPRGESYVVVSNHVSNWDPPLMAMLIRWRPIAYMAKKELFEKTFSRMLYRCLGTFSVNRQKVEKSTIKSAKMVLTQTDWLLGMFAEGTRHRDPQTLGEVKEGVASIAKMSNARLLPVGIAINGRQVAMTIGDMMPVPIDVAETTERLRVELLQLKQQCCRRVGL